MAAPSPPPQYSRFLDDENVLVLTKARFFRTLRILLDYAQHPERRTWEFFSYRAWDYILGTFCLTFDLKEFAISCGPQHPCLCVRPLPSLGGAPKAQLEYAQPDFTLMSNAFGKEGHLLFLGEAKPMGSVEPDTIDARDLASAIFLEVEPQRQRQVRLAFERHPESSVIKILMICGSFWSVWQYERSYADLDLPPASEFRREMDGRSSPSPAVSDSEEPDPSSPDRSPPHKIPRIDKTPPGEARYSSHRFYRLGSSRFKSNNDRESGMSDGNDDLGGLSPVPSPPSDPRDRNWRPNPQEQPLDEDLEWDDLNFKSRKKGKKGKKRQNEQLESETPSTSKRVHHVLELPNKEAFNPWFRHFLTEIRDTLIGSVPEKGSVQSSWFDWPTKEAPDGDGHAPGYVLPKATQPRDSETGPRPPKIVELIRADEPLDMADIIGLPLNEGIANALMSPRLSLPPPSAGAGSYYTRGPSRTPVRLNRFAYFDLEEDTVLPQFADALAESSDDDYGATSSLAEEYDDIAPSPTAESEEQRHLTPTPRRQYSRERSPVDSYLERKRQAPPQLERQPDSTGSAGPPPLSSQSLDDFASHEDGQVSAAASEPVAHGASAQISNDDAPPVASTPAPQSLAIAGSPRTSATESDAPISSNSRTTRLSDEELLAAKRRREKTWALLTGPLLAKKLPNGKRLPKDFFSMSREDQELLLTLTVPRAPPGVERDYGTAFRSTGMPEAQVRMMVTYVRGRHGALERSTGIALPHGPSASRSHSGGGQRDPDESLTAAMPPPPPPTSLPGSAEGDPRWDGVDDAQNLNSGLRPVSERAGPSTTTTDVASRTLTHSGSRVRAFDGTGAAFSLSRSAAASADDRSRSSVEPAPSSSGAPMPPRCQRRGDPVATTTAHMETLNLGRQPSGTDPGEGSSNRKRKDRQ